MRALIRLSAFLLVPPLLALRLFGMAAADEAIAVEATEYRFVPSEILVEPGGVLTVTLANTGQRPHDIRFELDAGREEGTIIIAGGESTTASFRLPDAPGEFVFYCSVGNHRELGMEGRLLVGLATTDPPRPTDTPATAEPTDEPTIEPSAQPTRSLLYMPRVIRYWPPVPAKPVLDPIDSSDLKPSYLVHWQMADLAESYVLYESMDPAMRGARVVLDNGSLAQGWRPFPDKTPGTYYYQVVARNSYGDSQPSAIQAVTIHPLFVGLDVRWDGTVTIRGSDPADIGTHLQISVSSAAGPGTVNLRGQFWNDPNPFGAEPSAWEAVHDAATGRPVSSAGPGDPDVKWGFFWLWVYPQALSSGSTVDVNGQAFTVSGPHAGQAAGVPVRFWQLENQASFVSWDDGTEWSTRVGPGDVRLRYDAGPSRLNLGYDLRETFYRKGRRTEDVMVSTDEIKQTNALAPPMAGLASGMVRVPSPVRRGGLMHLGRSAGPMTMTRLAWPAKLTLADPE